MQEKLEKDLNNYGWARKLQKSPPQHRDTLFPVASGLPRVVAARWRRAPKTHSLLITLFTSFSGAINREKRSRDFINQGKKCITVAQEKRQIGYGIFLMVGPNM